MKIFTEKRIIQKIIIAIIFVMMFNFIIPNISHADGEESGVNGVLFEPIKDFLVGIGDVCVWVMQKVVYGMDESFLDGWYEKYGIGGILSKAWGFFKVKSLDLLAFVRFAYRLDS